MKKLINKKVLSETSLYYGDIKLPSDWKIDRDQLLLHEVYADTKNQDFIPCPPFDILNSYIIEHCFVEYDLVVENIKSWGTEYNPLETSKPFCHVDYDDVLKSPDYILLYGVRAEDCTVRVKYKDNKYLDKQWNITLENNKFIMFPSSCMYYIENKQKEKSNFIHCITYKIL
jgi:hypothetical protein